MRLQHHPHLVKRLHPFKTERRIILIIISTLHDLNCIQNAAILPPELLSFLHKEFSDIYARITGCDPNVLQTEDSKDAPDLMLRAMRHIFSRTPFFKYPIQEFDLSEDGGPIVLLRLGDSWHTLRALGVDSEDLSACIEEATLIAIGSDFYFRLLVSTCQCSLTVFIQQGSFGDELDSELKEQLT